MTISVNLSFEWLPAERVFVLYQSAHEAEDAEWESYLESRRSLKISGPARLFVYSEGGRPTRDQQQKLVDMEKERWPIAVVSPSTAVRFVVSVFSLEIPTIRLFTPEQFDEACAYLGCNADEATAIRAALERAKLATAPAKIAGVPMPAPRARPNTTGPIRIPRTRTDQAPAPNHRGEPGAGKS